MEKLAIESSIPMISCFNNNAVNIKYISFSKVIYAFPQRPPTVKIILGNIQIILLMGNHCCT